MFRSSIVSILVVAIVLGSNASSDVTSIFNQTNVQDFLVTVAATFPEILGQTEYQIRAVLDGTESTETKMERIASFQHELSKMDSHFEQLLKEGDPLNPPTNLVQTLQNIGTLEAMRDQYVKGKERPSVFVERYEQLSMAHVSDTIRKGFIVEHNARSIIAKFQTLTFNAPKEMDVVVKGLIQMLIRTDVLYLTNSLLKNENQDLIDGILISLPQKMNETVGIALNLLEKISKEMKIQMKADIKRLLAQTSVNVQHICDIAMDLKSYFTNKYADFDFAVIAYSNFHRSVASICQGTYGLRVEGLNAVVAIKNKTDAPRDIESWTNKNVNSIPDFTGEGEPYLELSKKIFGTVGDTVCSNTDILAIIDIRESACLKSSTRINHSMPTKQVTRCYDSLCWSNTVQSFRIYVLG